MNQPLSSEIKIEIQSLVDTQLDGQLTPDQAFRLNQLLQNDAAVDFFVRYSNLHADLSWMRRGYSASANVQRGLQSPATEPHGNQQGDLPSRQRWAWIKPAITLVTAACVLFAFGNLLSWQPGTSPNTYTRGGTTARQPPQNSQIWDAESLSGLQLTLVGDASITWKFNDSQVEISASAGPLSPEFCSELGLMASCKVINASWELTDRNRTLRLFDMHADGNELKSDLWLPIRRAGVVRTNLGDRQYNQQRKTLRE